MTVDLTTPAAEIGRDRYGRPLVVPPTGGRPVAYTRCTTYVGAVEDTYNLSRWSQRMVALGLADRADLLLAVAAHRGDKTRLNQLCDDAKEAASAHAAATTGTALHAFTEQIDRGDVLGVVPADYVADLAAYTATTSVLKAVHIERFSVLDALKIGGTPDRVVSYQGKRYIADVKTGSIDWGFLKIAAQLAVYSRSAMYDIASGERTPHGCEVDRGIIIHLPAGTGACKLYWVDLTEGWDAVRVARRVREKRALKFPALVSDFIDPLPALSVQEEVALPGIARTPLTLEEQLRSCADPQGVRDLWALHRADWTPALTDLAKRHIASLG